MASEAEGAPPAVGARRVTYGLRTRLRQGGKDRGKTTRKNNNARRREAVQMGKPKGEAGGSKS